MITVEKMMCNGVFLTTFDTFANMTECCLECLIYLLNRN